MVAVPFFFFLNGQYKYYQNGSPDRFFLFYDGHPGVDYGVGLDTPVLATASGRIKLSDCPSNGSICSGSHGSGFGKLQIDHGNTLVTSYNHLSKVEVGIAVGSYVKKGQLIAKSGETGAPNNPHLHLSVLWTNGGIYIDPHG